MSAGIRFVVGAMLAVLFSALFSVEVHAQTRVALLAADTNEAAQDVRAHLTAAGFEVDIFDAFAATPTPGDLATYHVAFTWSHAPEYPYANAVAMGDVLADFVDSGRGVIQAGFALDSTPTFGLGGRWTAQQYGAFSLGGFDFRNNLTLVPVLPNHPILAGVASFSGGNAVPHMIVARQGCAELVARWSNNRQLVAAGTGPIAGRVVGLNFYPVSSDLGGQGWRTDTDGRQLLANAVNHAASAVAHSSGPAVGIVAADVAARVSDVRCKLHNLETFSTVDVIDAQSSTPTLATLQNYNAVLTWTGSSYADAIGMGNVLADYVDANGGVVHSPVSFDSGSRLDGRWIVGDYRPIIETDPASEANLQLVPFVSGHPMLAGVSSIDGGDSSHHTIALLNLVPDETPTVVANWSNGQPMVVFKKKASGGGHIASLNMFPPSSDELADSWNRLTDGARLMANMLVFVSNHAPTADAGDDRTIEATAAGVPVTLTATASDLDGDPLTKTWSGVGPATTGDSFTFTAMPPASGVASRTHTVTLTVTDGKGGEAIDVVNIVVEDTDGPVLQGVPGDATLEATGPDGAPFSYGPVTANDAVDSGVLVTCAPSSGSVFPVGNTVVTCSASDSRGNGTTSSFTVTVTEGDGGGGGEDPATPGKVFGYGFIRNDDMRYEFTFSAVERASGLERGGLLFTVKSGYCSHHRHTRRHNDRFVSRSVDSVVFEGHSSVVFKGTGRWNGREGYSYEVSAVEKRGRSRRYDVVGITIKSSTGVIVAQVNGTLGGGNVQFVRLPQ